MKLTLKLKTAFIYSTCLMLTTAYPLSVFADEATPPPAETLPVEPVVTPAPLPPTDPAPAQPVAPTAPSPVAPPPTYMYDAATGRWNTDQWTYDPVSNTYIPTPKVVQPLTPVQPTHPDASSTSLSATTNANIANALDSLALTGDASVTKNTAGGSALTGDAAATATIINNINSSMSNTNNKAAASFVSNIMGDVNGDIMLQPMLLKAMLEANIAKQQNLTSSNNTSINNDLNLTAQSGDATVASNTSAGNAGTGSANTVADVVNLVNSMVASNQSFMGTINIYGNLNGDILIAPDFIPQLLAANGSTDQSSSTKASTSDTQSIVNNVALAAESGKALVSGNTAAGSATTGDASTNLVIFNLTGHQIVASNSLLVFINVLGQWVGVIVDAPVGATAAAIGNDVTTNNVSPSMVIDTANQTQITNNIKLASLSGDATVAGNTQAGNASTGKATASANIANISNSSLGLSGWFGVLFINVFGSWHGSFGIDTDAGNPVVQQPGEPVHVIQFIPRDQATKSKHKSIIVGPGVTTSGSESSTITQQASASTDTPTVKSAHVTSDIPSQEAYSKNRGVSIPLTIGSIVLVGASLIVLRRYIF